MTGYEHLCMNCMSETAGKTQCPHCGFDEAEPQPKEALPYRTVLQDRYMVGRMKRSNGEGKVYIGFDMQQLCPVQIHEFFPLPICARVLNSTDIAVIAGNEGLFEQYLKDFLTYQQALSQFQNQPAIVPVTDVFEENYTAYAISPWEESITLRYFVKRSGGFLTWNACWKIFKPVITALTALHASGVGHLGISPDTLFISQDGEMKLNDFCISAARMTDTGLQMDLTPGCAAIEQFDASMDVGESTDVYGLAASLFFALTGILPKDARTRLKDPRLLLPASKLKSIPPHVVTAMANALEVSQQDRTPTFERIRAELAAAPTATVSLEETQSLRRIPSPYPESKQKTAPPEASRKKTGKKPTYLWVILLCVILAIAAVVVIAAYNLFFDGGATPTSSQANLGASSTSQSMIASLPAPASSQNVSSNSERNTNSEAASSEAASEDSSQEEETTSSQETTSSDESSQSDSDEINVPNLVGQSYSDVKNASDYQVTMTDKRFSDTVPEGNIIEQTPAKGESVKKGSVVSVVVSLGSALRELPDISGMSQSEARKAVEDAGLLPSIQQKSSDEPTGTVLGYADTEAGAQLAYGAEVTILVSSGS